MAAVGRVMFDSHQSTTDSFLGHRRDQSRTCGRRGSRLGDHLDFGASNALWAAAIISATASSRIPIARCGSLGLQREAQFWGRALSRAIMTSNPLRALLLATASG